MMEKWRKRPVLRHRLRPEWFHGDPLGLEALILVHPEAYRAADPCLCRLQTFPAARLLRTGILVETARASGQAVETVLDLAGDGSGEGDGDGTGTAGLWQERCPVL